MPICDICGSELTQNEMNLVDPKLIVDATDRGYIPRKLPLEELDAAFGLDRADIWRSTVRGNSTAQWGLCSECMQEVRAFGTKKWWEFWKSK
jgi:hypothetical protein